MSEWQAVPGSTVLAGGHDGVVPPREGDAAGDGVHGGNPGHQDASASIGARGPAADRTVGGTAAGAWPDWARVQLEHAIEVAAGVPDGLSTAGVLYRRWFNPVVIEETSPRRRPLVGLYRSAHVGSCERSRHDGLNVVGRHDVIGSDGWWRTWGERWTPPRTRPRSVRILCTPHPEALGDFVRAVTGSLLHRDTAWSLACATDPRRLRRTGSAVLDLPGLEALPVALVDALTPLLVPVTPPLGLPIATGLAVTGYPDNGMTFGEHRCHLIALALRHPSSDRKPLRAIGAVFSAHGINPATPHRAG